MSNTSLRESFQVNEWLSMLASQLLVIGMMVCLATSVRNLAQRIVPAWRGEYVPWLALILSLEAIYSRRLLRRESDLFTSTFVYRLGEWVVIAMLIKLYLAASTGLGLFLQEMLSWGQAFLTNFFDAEYLFVLFLSFIIWYLSGDYASLLMELEGDRFLLEGDVEIGIVSDRTATRKSLAMRYLAIGMVVVTITAFVRWDNELIWGNQSVLPYGLSYVMVYFFLGLALITLAHFSARRATWALDRIPLSRDMARAWLVYGLLFLAGVSLLASLLPAGYSIGLLETLGYLLNLFYKLLQYLFYLLSLPVIFIIRLLSRSTEVPQLDEFMPTPKISPPPATLVQPASLPWVDLLRSIVFWAVFLAIVVYAFKIILEQNEHLLAKLRKIPGWQYLARFWSWLVKSLSRANQQLGTFVRASLQSLWRPALTMPKVAPPPSLLSLRSLTPRQKVLFFYLAFLRRGEESGLPRQPAQTPFEYARRVEDDLPEVNEELDTITDMFVEARYSQHTITPESARLVRRYWRSVLQALRERKQRGS